MKRKLLLTSTSLFLLFMFITPISYASVCHYPGQGPQNNDFGNWRWGIVWQRQGYCSTWQTCQNVGSNGYKCVNDYCTCDSVSKFTCRDSYGKISYRGSCSSSQACIASSTYPVQYNPCRTFTGGAGIYPVPKVRGTSTMDSSIPWKEIIVQSTNQVMDSLAQKIRQILP